MVFADSPCFRRLLSNLLPPMEPSLAVPLHKLEGPWDTCLRLVLLGHRAHLATCGGAKVRRTNPCLRNPLGSSYNPRRPVLALPMRLLLATTSQAPSTRKCTLRRWCSPAQQVLKWLLDRPGALKARLLETDPLRVLEMSAAAPRDVTARLQQDAPLHIFGKSKVNM